MNLNMKKVSVPVLMFLMSQSGFGVSNANFGNANLALAQKDDAGKARAVRCLTDEAIKKDEASGGNDHAELKKLLVGSTTPQQIGAMLKEAYIEYLVPRNNAGAVRDALKGKSSVEEMVATLVDTNLFTKNSTGKYLWWTIDGYDDPTDSIKGKFNAVVDQILGKTEQADNWKDIEVTGTDDDATAQAQAKKDNATLLLNAITDSNNKIAGLTTNDFEGNEWWTYNGEQQHTAAGENWKGILKSINDIVIDAGVVKTDPTYEDKESIIDALQVFLGDRLMDKLINPETENKGEALENFFEGHFMREVANSGFIKDAFDKAFDNVKFLLGIDVDTLSRKNAIYREAYDAVFDTIEGLLRSKDAPVNLEMFDEDGIKLELFKKTLVNQLDNLAPDEGTTKNRSWAKIKETNTNLAAQLKRLVWIDDDDNDVAGAKESDNESYDYDSSDINGGDSDEEQAKRAEEAVKEGLESADKLIPQP